MDNSDNSQVQGEHLNLSRKPEGAHLERFTRLLEDCVGATKRCSTPAEALGVIFGPETRELLGYTKGYVAVVDVTEETVWILHWINQEQWDRDGDKQVMEHFAGIKRPTKTKQSRLVIFMRHFGDSYITPDFKEDENFSAVLREAISMKTVIVTPLMLFNDLVGVVLAGYPEYPSPEVQWMHEHLITYATLPVMQSYWFNDFRRKIETTKKWRLLGESVGLIIHGFKTPIGSLAVFFDLLAARRGDLSKNQLAIQRAKNSLNDLKLLTDNLLSYVKGPSTTRAATRVKDLLQRAVSSSVPQAKGLPISGNALERAVFVDSTEIVLVLRNLINNAFESAEGKAGKTGQPAVVRINASGDESELTISVLDNGEGVPEASIKEIFEPFETTKGEGHGLGLAVAQSFVIAHGGRMTVRKREEGGACFEIILPWQAVEKRM